MSPINGTPQPKKFKALGGTKPGGRNWAKKMGAGKDSSGCLIAALTLTALGSGWLHMIATSAGWVS